jgi:hypothetical protein
MNNKSKKQKIKAEEAFLRQLFYNWDPIISGMPPHTPMDEYDYLVHKIISRLHTGIDYDGLLKLISDDLCVKVTKQELIENTKQIWNWWKETQ